ncbi:MAG: ABC transporter permease [Planctomycetes bacterium]|nr:ABC transporter permease [Planctomycetota bacterium]
MRLNHFADSLESKLVTKEFNIINNQRIRWFNIILTLLGSSVVLFIIAPLINIIIATSITDLKEAAIDHQVIQSIKLTLMAAFLATLTSALAGIPLAYLLARKKFFGRSILLAIIDLPIIIPHSAAGIALLTVIGRQSFIGRFLGKGLTGTAIGISVAMAFVSLPFLVNAARQAFEAVPEKLEKVARTLGASPSRTFFTISLPLAWRGILSGMILMWARGISEFGAVVIIAYHPMTTPVMVFQRFNDYGLSYARSVAVLLILICVSIFVILRLLNYTKGQEPTNA